MRFGYVLAACSLLAAVGVAPAASAAEPPLTATVLPAASSFTSQGQRGITRRVFLQSKIGLTPTGTAQCDGRTLPAAPARTGAVEGLYVTRDNRVAMIETVFRYRSVAAARQAVSAYAAIAGCARLRNGWAGFTPTVTNVATVPSSTVVGDESRFLRAQEPVAKSAPTQLHLAILRSGRYVVLTQNFRGAPLDASSLPALVSLGRRQLATLSKGT